MKWAGLGFSPEGLWVRLNCPKITVYFAFVLQWYQTYVITWKAFNLAPFAKGCEREQQLLGARSPQSNRKRHNWQEQRGSGDFPEAPQHERVSHLLLRRRRERREKRLLFIFFPIKTVLQGDSAKWAKPSSCYPINKIVHIVWEL